MLDDFATAVLAVLYCLSMVALLCATLVVIALPGMGVLWLMGAL